MEVEDLSMPPRSYDSSGRQAQARATRARVRDAAAALFIAQGYAGTSLTAIAREAEVAPQTIYAMFGAKANLLKEVVEVALAGDDEPVAVADRPHAQRAREASTPAEAAAATAAMCRQIFDRSAALLAMANVAAIGDPEIAEMARIGYEGRLLDMRRAVEGMAAGGFLRDGIATAEAVDHVWALTSPDVYLSCIRERGWSPARYERWLRAALGLVIG
jgi:AcrR family transcriptional regulator